MFRMLHHCQGTTPVQATFELTAARAPRNKVFHFGTGITLQNHYCLDPISQAVTPLRL